MGKDAGKNKHFQRKNSENLVEKRKRAIFAASSSIIIAMRRPEIVSRIMLALRNKVPQATTILYGSEARGDARPDSDIDLLVLLPQEKITYADRDQVIDALYDIEIESGVAISPYIVSEKMWKNRPFQTPFYQNVTAEGINLSIEGEYEGRIR